jgi:HEPN domain-containing protein
VRILWRLAAPFPLDLIVRTPKEMAWRLDEGESFLTTIVSQGKVLYEKDDERVGQKGRRRLPTRQGSRSKIPVHDGVCFHCQQCAEKYLKGLMEEAGIVVPKTHFLDKLLSALAPSHPTLRSLRRGLLFLTNFAVDFRHPGSDASKRQAVAALRWVHRVRTQARSLLGIRERRRTK